MATVDEITPICFSARYELLPQQIHGNCTTITDPYSGCHPDQPLKKLKDQLPPSLTPLNNGQLPQNQQPIKVAVVYTTTKAEKIKPLGKALSQHFDWLRKTQGMQIDEPEVVSFDVHTGVGQQPYHPSGLEGAINRIKSVQDEILKEVYDGKEIGLMKLNPSQFHRIIFPSMESDIVEEGSIDDPDRTPYDKPNLIIYEWVTGEMCAGMGRGPGCQKEILQLAQRLGIDLMKDNRAVTYGFVLVWLFSGLIHDVLTGEKVEFKSSDWHRIVLGEDFDRAYFVTELCEFMKGKLKGILIKIFE